MNSLFRNSLIFIAFLLVSACGQKGPLYLPENQADSQRAAASAQSEETEQEFELVDPLEDEQP